MTGLKLKIQGAMIGETAPGPVLKLLLVLLSRFYGMLVRLRRILYDHGIFRTRRLPCGVISIGNLTVGGTGKTPMTIYLADLLKNSGYRPVVISRGYKGRAEKKGGVVSDRDKILLGADIAGDEPFLMAQRLEGIPVLVGADRFKAGMKAVNNFFPDVIVLDDAFQHCRLHRDMDIVLIDDKSFLGNRHLLPRGILREPASSMARADLFVLTRCDGGKSRSYELLSEMASGKPVFKSSHEPYVCGIYNGEKAGTEVGIPLDASRNFDFLKKANVFVFSGIAKNEEFLNTVESLFGRVAGVLAFDDHHRYSEPDFRRISEEAKKCAADYIVTTEKDYVKIAHRMHSPVDIVVIGVRLSLGVEESQFLQQIIEKIVSIRY